jgi:hypothetical protein
MSVPFVLGAVPVFVPPLPVPVEPGCVLLVVPEPVVEPPVLPVVELVVLLFVFELVVELLVLLLVVLLLVLPVLPVLLLVVVPQFGSGDSSPSTATTHGSAVVVLLLLVDPLPVPVPCVVCPSPPGSFATSARKILIEENTKTIIATATAAAVIGSINLLFSSPLAFS